MKNTRFLMKISLLLLTPAFICVVVAVLIAVHGLRQKTESDLLGASRSAITQLEAARDYVARMNVFSRQAAELAQKYPDGKIPLEEKKQLMLSVPIVSALELKGVGEKEGGYEARVISDNARRPVNAPKTDEENRILKSFRADAALKELNFEENGFIYVARPIRLHESQGCLACHGAPARSPWGNGKDIVGFQMEDMKDGDLKGAFVIKTSLAPVRAESWRIFATVAGWSLLVCVLIIAVSIFVLRGTLNRLVGTIQKLRETGESLTSKAGEVSGTSEALQQGTERSAQAIEQAQVAMEQIVSMARSNGDNAQAASTSARETRGQTQSVVDETREVVGAIHQIQESMLALSRDVEKGNADLGQVVSVIRGIGDKVKVINEIVFQTKLLSFNASVEAARAGEHGKGFAVVAEEIGNLAVMSGNSAQEIEKLLADSVRQVEGMVEDMRRRVVASVAQGRTTVDAGVNLANRSLESLNRIASIAGEMERSVESITTAGQEQVKGAEQVKLGVSDLSEVVSETFKSSNQLRGQSGDLAGLSDQLRVLAGDLESLIDSRAGKDAA